MWNAHKKYRNFIDKKYSYFVFFHVEYELISADYHNMTDRWLLSD